MQALLDAGADRVSLADIVGYADPAGVRCLCEKARALAGERLVAAHFHAMRRMGLASCYAAWQTGITRFDACLADETLHGTLWQPGLPGHAMASSAALPA